MNQLSTGQRATILSCLIEGNSVMATSRITGAAKNTILKFLEEAGEACEDYQNRELRNLPCKVLQLDEIWSFVGCKERTKNSAKGQHPGDVWTWTAICAETKLIPSWSIGDRSAYTADEFCSDLSTRFNGRVQITSDGNNTYKMAVGVSFREVDFAQLVKIYGTDKYGQEIVTGTRKEAVYGRPDMDLVSTSYVERHNLTIRMSNRRYTRLTNAFSKKLENHCHMMAVMMMHYNFCRKHMSIKTTPAVAAEVTDHQWKIEEMVEMIDLYWDRKNREDADKAFAEAFDNFHN